MTHVVGTKEIRMRHTVKSKTKIKAEVKRIAVSLGYTGEEAF